MTDAERVLWHHLRARRLAGCKFRRQLIIEPYIVDFACIEAKLIIEVEGSQHAGQQIDDDRRTAYLEGLGYRVLRFWNHGVLTATPDVLACIHQVLLDRSPRPSPSP